mmetsp:Transcript_14627/g.46503  ORF Transcript_14627/g.46503 Transcript_14627/m.46503 type:complete len:185 (-) Transcript_14627:45-599(-)
MRPRGGRCALNPKQRSPLHLGGYTSQAPLHRRRRPSTRCFGACRAALLRCARGMPQQYYHAVGNKTTVRVQNTESAGSVFGIGKAGEFCLIRLGPERPRRAGCEVYLLSPQYESYSRGLWTALWGGGGSQMMTWGEWTSGFLALSVALHLCGHVDIYGLSESSGERYWLRDFGGEARDHPHLYA